MKTCYKRLSILIVIIFAGILLLPGSAVADPAGLPVLDFVGNFTYTERQGGLKFDDWLLDFTDLPITGGNYIDLSSFGEGDDPVTDAYIVIGYLYNDDPSDNFIFSDVQPSGGNTGTVSFTITDGTTTYLTAQLVNFQVDYFFSPNFNGGYNRNSLVNPTFTSAGSQYISELEARFNAGSGLTLEIFIDFTFNSPGLNDFTEDGFGSVGGKVALGSTATFVELAYFTASPLKGDVLIEWGTETEIDCAYFLLWRSDDGGTPAIIPASLTSCTGDGSDYSFVDDSVKNRKKAKYVLVEVDLYGTSTSYRPVSVTRK